MCQQRLNVPNNLGDLTVICPRCNARWDWSKRAERRRRRLLGSLACAAVLAAAIGITWWCQTLSLSNWRDQIAATDGLLQSGDYAASGRSLDQVEQDRGVGPGWYWLPMTRREWRSLKSNTTDQRTKLAEAVRRESKITEWDRALATSGQFLKSEDYSGLERSFIPIELDVATSKDWNCLPATASRLSSLRAKTQFQRAALDKAAQYTARVRSVLAAVKVHLSKSAHKEAVDAVQKALAESVSDPVLESIAAFVERLRKENRPWQERDAVVLDQMGQQALEWRKIRTKNLGAGYVDFLARHSDSPFAQEAKARLIDLQVADIMKQEHGQLPAPQKNRR